VVIRFTAGSPPASELSPDYDRYYAWLTSEYIANGLADLARTGAFALAVSERLANAGHTVPAGAIQGAIASDNAQSVLTVYVTWSGPADQAVAIAEALSAELLESGPEYYPQMPADVQLARQSDPIVAIAIPPSLQAQLLQPAIRLLIAAAVGAGLMALAHAFDPRLHGSEDLSPLGIDVVGTLPRAPRG
jgi:hypothetical protein